MLKTTRLVLHGRNQSVLHIHKKAAAPSTSQQTRWRSSQGKTRNRRGVNFDTFGTWDNRINAPIMIQQSIKHGKIIPKVSIDDVGHASLTGRRKVNEDRICIKELTGPDLLYFAVFDGHAGSLIADYASVYLEHFIRFWLDQEKDLQSVLKHSFIDFNNVLTRHMHFEYEEPEFYFMGSTATVCLLRDGIELVVASVGDSRAILCRKGVAKRLTKDHEPEDPDEAERIKANKGFISWNSLGTPLVNGSLTMTRSFGDLPLKRYGVIAEPETTSLEVRHNRDSFLVLSTDGVNFVMNDQELCEAVNRAPDPSEAALRVADQALQYGSDDNCTAIVVPFGQWGKFKSTAMGYSRNFFSNRF
ncbi:protein phosphatase Mn(2+)-dependent 1K-like [Saccoglossus kowalevskii]|uniref:Protein phosphatase 1K, mitochondrial-like n=1 Tax=Saccoglossus kowalevskii TaxID=10224 RepID=A0ABM0GTP2_SACKO|nr:PREDICTED: protein phosphatase 1K, mitochondrial-like [Saccoglossus kowalevskii]